MKQALLAISLAMGIATPILSINAQSMAQAKPAAAQELVAAEVKKVDKEGQKVVLAHGEIKAFDMPAMTMTYIVKDPAMFVMLSEGAKVRVALEKTASGYAVIHVEPAG